MPRLLLSDELWSKLEKILLQESIYNKRDLRMTVEGMLYRMRVGCPWRDLPKAFWCWNSIYKPVKGNADLDRGLYRYRHLVENAFARLQHYRAVASRYDKLKRNYESMVAIACGFLWLPM
jgi:transposase